MSSEDGYYHSSFYLYVDSAEENGITVTGGTLSAPVEETEGGTKYLVTNNSGGSIVIRLANAAQSNNVYTLTFAAPEGQMAGGFPLFVKPANAGSSVGVNKANDLESLKDAVQIAFTHDEKVIIEEFIDGRELEVAVFGYDAPIASYVGEIEPAAEFYDYDDKYVNGTSKLYIPARITDQESDRIRETALRAYQALGCKGLSRVDFFLAKDGSVILNEINTLPGFTSISMYPKLMEHLGMSQEYLVDKLIEQAMENAART